MHKLPCSVTPMYRQCRIPVTLPACNLTSYSVPVPGNSVLQLHMSRILASYQHTLELVVLAAAACDLSDSAGC